MGIRFAAGLVGAAAGLALSDAILSELSLNATGFVQATIVFWLVHIVVQLLALRVLVREPSIALAGLLALAATVISLIVANAIVSGLTIHGLQTYVYASLIVWFTTATCDFVGRRMLRERRRR